MPYQQHFGFVVEVVDIDRDDRLRALYDEKVPVLSDGEQEICHYFLDEAALQRHFEQSRTDAG